MLEPMNHFSCLNGYRIGEQGLNMQRQSSGRVIIHGDLAEKLVAARLHSFSWRTRIDSLSLVTKHLRYLQPEWLVSDCNQEVGRLTLFNDLVSPIEAG
jgi:hypothetical protein